MAFPKRRSTWVILAIGTLSQAATCSFIYGIPMLVPALRANGLSLFGASVVVSAPIVGILATLILWGAAADRYGERVVMGVGLALSAAFLVMAAAVHGTVAVLDRIETDARFRRRGLGRRVVDALTAWARSEGARSGLLVASTDGRALYLTLGWEVVAPERIWRGAAPRDPGQGCAAAGR